MESNTQTMNIKEFAKLIGMGYYKVRENGEFLEADSMARELFGIPQDETDLSKHSIEKRYIFPAERKPRLNKLKNPQGKPISSTLSLRIKNENRLLFDQCWHDGCDAKGMCIAGLVAKIEDRVIFPKMFEEFPMGIYEVDDNNKFIRFNKKTMEIFGCKEEELLKKDIGEFYVNNEEMKRFSEEVNKNDHAHDILKFKNIHNKVMELECFTERISEFNIARWGMLHDVTKRERYYRALDQMPTGYYYIEYDENEEHRHHGRIVQCNEQFANILGVENKADLIGEDVTKFYASREEGENYFKHLDEADKKGMPVLDHQFRLKRANNGKIVHIAVDSHLVKENGKVIGREGTIRDISEKVQLEEKVKNTEKHLDRIIADINNLMHTFLHPVLKYSGHSELFHQLGRTLFKSIRLKNPVKTDIRKLGEELENKLIDIQKGLKYISNTSESAAVLEQKFQKIINILDYDLDKAIGSKILMDKAIRNASLCILEELERIGFFNENFEKGPLEDVINNEFIEYLQDILFDYLIRTARILQNETRVMRREVEALRRYIELGEKRIYNFRICNLAKILDENIEVFKPILAQRDIEIEYTPPRHLDARISETDIDRVICNLFHNAAKYSYGGLGRVVKIKTRDLYRENTVEFSICSYGIPIKQTEIDSGAIFKFGYRSSLVYKKNRDGTGVGLADAKDVIDQHGGEITITSEPVRDDGAPPRYKVPYITTVTVRLPKT